MRAFASAVAALLAGVFAGVPAAAIACDTSGATFTDTFAAASFDQLWTPATKDYHRTADGGLVLEPSPGTTEVVLSQKAYGDASICADLAIVSGPDDTNSVMGVAFWGVDSNNFYMLDVDPDGDVYVDQLSSNTWKTIASYGKSTAVVSGAGARNSLSVTTSSGKAEFFINGTSLGSIIGSAPSGGQKIGVMGSSPDQGTVDVSAAQIVAAESSTAPADNTTPAPVEVAPGDHSRTASPPDQSSETTPTPGPTPPQAPDYSAAAYQPNDAQQQAFAALIASGLTDEQDWFEFDPGKSVTDASQRPAVEFAFDDSGFFDDGRVDFVAFASDADAQNYLAGDEASAFAKDVAAWAKGDVQYGRIRDDKDREIIWAGRAVASGDENIAAAVQSGDVVIVVWLDTYADSDALDDASLDDSVDVIDVALDGYGQSGT